MTYQDRYVAHQLRKKVTLMKLMKQRHSTRMFSDKEIEPSEWINLLGPLEFVPSSCDRKGVNAFVVTERDKKALLGGLLVGGVGWLHRAPLIIMLFADSKAYVEGTDVMPYLDAGVQVAHIYLLAEDNGLKACYVNPNIREEHKSYFRDAFGSDIFCGAMAIGYPYEKE